MDYPLENLGPERFQEFSKALLLREHPNVQCFPVAQPDGGRDAISYVCEHHRGKFIVYQIKFSRRPLAEQDPHKWLLAIMDEETPKLERLIPRGASQFYLITNIPGTAHLDSGAIDRLNADMSARLTIPFTCWWRDDINRRLDDAWALKWTYPDLMTGPDFLRAIAEAGITEARERRESTIRAFVTTQYRSDDQVRFKQVDLQSNLLELFVDVPAGLRDHGNDPRHARLFHDLSSALALPAPEVEEENPAFPEYRYVRHEEIGAATLLLNPHFQARMPHIVLEGAPGQIHSRAVRMSGASNEASERSRRHHCDP